MNRQVENPKKLGRIVEAECQPIARSDPHFGPWLKEYLKQNRSSFVGSGRKHKYWLVPISLVEDSISILARGHDHCFLATCYKREGSDEYLSVLAIAPQPTKWDSMRQSVYQAAFLLALKATDFWCKWCIKRCPNCFSKDLHAFTYVSADEPHSHFCNGCNTIWPPRA